MRNGPDLTRKPVLKQSLVSHRNFSNWSYRQQTKLANLNRQDYTLNIDGEELEGSPLS